MNFVLVIVACMVLAAAMSVEDFRRGEYRRIPWWLYLLYVMPLLIAYKAGQISS